MLGVSSLSLAAVATADLLSGTGIALTWAAEALLLVVGRVAAPRCSPAGDRARLLRASPRPTCFSSMRRRNWSSTLRSRVSAAASVAALALALLGAGLLAPAETAARTETGLLAWLAHVRSWLADHRVGLQEGLCLGGAAAGDVRRRDPAHRLLVPPRVTSRPRSSPPPSARRRRGLVAARLRQGLVAASFVWIGGVFAIAAAFDVPEFALDAAHRSYGGWALIAASAGVLAACFAFQLLAPQPGPTRRAGARRRRRPRRIGGRHRTHLARR